MKTKVSHSLLLLLAAAPLALAQVPAGIPGDPNLSPSPAVNPPAPLEGATEALPPPAIDDPGNSPAPAPLAPAPEIPPVVASGSPDGPVGQPPPAPPLPDLPGLPGAPAPVDGPATGAGSPLPPRTSYAPPPSATTPAPFPPPPVAPPPVAVAAPPRSAKPRPSPAAVNAPNSYNPGRIYNNPNGAFVAESYPPGSEPMMAAPTPSARGEQVIRDIKLKVLQRHYEATLSEAVEAEKASLFAAPAERESLAAKAKALREFAGKLEADIRALPEPRLARVSEGRNPMNNYGGHDVGTSAAQPQIYYSREVRGADSEYAVPPPTPALAPAPHWETHHDSGPAPAEARGRKREASSR